MRYRELREQDIEAIARVHRRACLIAYAFMNWSYSEEAVRDWYIEKFHSWDWRLVAEENELVRGFIACTGSHLDQLFVDPDYQGRGIGTFLLTEAIARHASVRTLHVFEDNALARAFYERYGFREVGRYYNDDEGATELVYGR